MAPEFAAHRARSADQKLERRQDIMQAGDVHLRDVGYEAFSMASLAKSVGLAKGTLYLYFHTREELFLALCEAQVDQWATQLTAELQPDMDEAAFCQAFYRSAMADANLVTLMLRLNVIIEHNVSIDALIHAKRAMRNTLSHVVEAMAANMALSSEQAMEIVTALTPLLLGTAQSDQGPTLSAEELPEDVQAFVNSFPAEHTFLTNARRIVTCIRAGH